MIFHSLDFVVFFLAVVAIYWCLPHRAQNVLLLVASYFFYGYIHPWFLALIATTTVVDYWAARGMAAQPARKRWFLGASLAVNLGMLGFFKYFNFFLDNVTALLHAAGLATSRPALAIILPVGISFYTFQELTYTIDVYRGRLQARTSLLDVATFVAFFPQLVAGPIERAGRLLPQVERPRTFSWPLARDAMFLILWGYFKKLVIADNVGVIANKVFSLGAPGFTVLWAGVFAFGIQIFADFSAYSDIARGTAQWLGFDLMKNFDQPYLARGVADFWHRWHISLSSWFRDYVYIPLGGSRVGRAGQARNLMATFLLSGFWHGASWNYLLWGGFHGSLLVMARLAPGANRLRDASASPPQPSAKAEAPGLHPRGEGVPAVRVEGALGLQPRGSPWRFIVIPLQILGTFLLVNVGWLLFRETDIHMLLRDLTLSPFRTSALDRQAGTYLFLMAAAYSLPLWLHAAWDLAHEGRAAPATVAPPIKGAGRLAFETAVAGVLFAVLLVFRSRTSLDFIYFQF